VTTAHDLLAWDRALRGEKILDAKAKAKFYKPFRDGYALGWFVEPTERGTTRLSHGGGVMGFSTQYVRYLEDDVTIVVLTNNEGNLHAIEERLSDILFPSSLELTCRLKGMERDNLTLEEGTSWKIERAGDRVTLRLRADKQFAEIATLTVPVGAAKALLAQVETLNGQKEKGEKEPRMQSGVYLARYTLDESKELKLTEGLKLTVLPKYEGVGEGGKKIEDDRVTFIVVDKSIGQWPLMVLMNVPAAEKFCEGLRKAVEKGDR
jgi:hypothetical protein